MLLISSDISKVSCHKPLEKVEQCIVTAVYSGIYCMTKAKVNHIITEDVLLTTFINIYASMYMIMVKVPCKFKFKNPPFFLYIQYQYLHKHHILEESLILLVFSTYFEIPFEH